MIFLIIFVKFLIHLSLINQFLNHHSLNSKKSHFQIGAKIDLGIVE